MIGASLPRVEDLPLLTGRARFVDDIHLDGTLHVAFHRSSLAHARVRSVDTSAAAALPGVEAVLTGAELGLPDLTPPIMNRDAWSPPRPLLARDLVRFAGEPVAVAAASSRYVAEDACELVVTDYEPLPALVEVNAAMAAGAPLLHAHDSNVIFDSTLVAGDVDSGFGQAAAVVEATLRNPRYSAAPMEARGLVAMPEGDALVLWSSTQVPHRLGSVVAELLGLPPSAVRVIVPFVGGGFGQKAHVYPEEVLVAWLALELRRPIKWIEDRAENLLAGSHARDQEVRVRAAADAEGRLLAVDADVVCDTGAYGVFPHGHILEALGTPAMIPGPYRLGAYRVRGRSVATNKSPEGAYRGVGLPVSTLVHEWVMDALARRLRLDRAEVRRVNFVRPSDFPYTTLTHQRYDSGDYGRALEMALEAVGYEGFPAEQEAARREGKLLGLGISSYVEYSGMGSAVFHGRGMVGIAGYDGAHVRLGADGSATVWTTLPAIGQGVHTTFAQLVAQDLGLEVEKVRVENCDTMAGGLDGTGTFASRSAVAGGGALGLATAELRRRLLEAAAERLEVGEFDLELAGGEVRVKGAPARSVPLAELVESVGEEAFQVSERFDPPQVAYPYATHCCKVEVDAETGAVEVLAYAIAEDCGRVINPQIVDGQVHGATAQGIGGALYEQLWYGEDGQLQTASFMDYLLPTAVEMPALTLRHLEIPAPGSPTGAKGVGEGGTLAPPAAILNAVSDALGGVVITQLPLSPARVLAAAHGR